MLVWLSKSISRYWLFLLWIICIFLATYGLWQIFPWLHQWAPNDSSDIASWIQAVGSISAILVTTHIARRDTRVRNADKESIYAREMRRIAYHLNTSGLSARIIDFLEKSSRTESSYFNNFPISYRNIYFAYSTISFVKDLYSTKESIESSVMMELQTSELCDDFFAIFNAIDALNSQYKFIEPLINIKPELNFIRNYIDFVNKNSEENLTRIDTEINYSMDFIEQLIVDLREGRNSIKRSMNDPS